MPAPAVAAAAVGSAEAGIAARAGAAASSEGTYAAAAAQGAGKAEAAASALPHAAPMSRLGTTFGGASRDAAKASRVHDLWAWHSLLSQAGSQAAGWLPRFQHTIAVTVVGGPRSTLKSIWQLALATVFGRYRQSAQVGTQTGSIECTWDITGKVVGVKLYYENNGLIELGNRKVLTSNGQRFGTGGIGQFLATGPSGETVGGPFVAWLDGSPVSYAQPPQSSQTTYVGGMPQSADASKTKSVVNQQERALSYGFILPDDGRVITTEFKDSLDVQPIRPEFDLISRTIPYIALVANALTDPGYLPASPPTNKQKKKRYGKRIYAPGKAPGTELQNKKFTVPNLFPVETTFEASLERKFTTLDGYPLIQPDDEFPDVKGVTNGGT